MPRRSEERQARRSPLLTPFERKDAGRKDRSMSSDPTDMDLLLPAEEDASNNLSLVLETTPSTAAALQTPKTRTIVATSAKLSPFKTSLSLLKCVVGAGSFILPSAVRQAGLVAGFVSLLLLGALSAYTINQLAQAGRMVKRANPQRRDPTYVDVGHAILGRPASVVIGLGVVLTILGVCAVYLDFIGTLAAAVVGHGVTSQQVQAVLVLPVILLALLRDFKYLAWTSIVGDIAVTAGAITVIAYGAVKKGITSPHDLPAFHADTYSSFFGQAVFLFAVHSVILPISQASAKPRRFPVVTWWTFGGVAVANALFGALGYMAFTDKTSGLVLSNLGSSVVGKVVNMFLAVDLLFTIPIVLSAPRRIIERLVIPRGDPHTVLKENAARVVCVGLFVALALAVPDINDLATLVGGLVSPLMGFIFPPVFYLRLFWSRLPWHTRIFNIVIVLFGMFAGTLTTVQQVQKMVKEGSHHHGAAHNGTHNATDIGGMW